MTICRSLISAIHRHPLATCLALALSAPLSGAITVRAAAPANTTTPIHRSPVHSAATLPVTSCADDGSTGSLRSVIADASSGDTIDLSQLTCSTITLVAGQIAIAQDDLTLSGPGASNLTIVGNGTSRVFAHSGAGTLSVDAVSLTGGYAGSAGANGGCLSSTGNLSLTSSAVSGCSTGPDWTFFYENIGGGLYAQGDIELSSSTISGNSAARGGGVAEKGNLTIDQSTVSNNYAFNCGGALYAMDYYHKPLTVSITNSTISGNTAVQNGGAGYVYGEQLILSNDTVVFNQATSRGGGFFIAAYGTSTIPDVNAVSSIIAGNMLSAPFSTANDIQAGGGDTVTPISGSNNLIVASFLPVPADTINEDPLLLPLADNGGPTQTHALASGSPAIDGGSNLLGLAFDQRGVGFPRVFGTGADIGAFEVQQSFSAPSVTKSFAPDTVVVNSLSTLTIALGNGSSSVSTLTSALTDVLPAPAVVANPPDANTNCPSGIVTASAGSSTVALNAGAQIPPNGSCTVTVSVIAHSSGTATNVIAAGDLQTDSGSNPDPGTAVLTVTGQAQAPTVAKAFEPFSIVTGSPTVLTITLANGEATSATLTADLVDSFPPPLVVADPANASTTCPDGVVTGDAGTGSVTLGSGAQIPSGTCTVTVSVTAAAAGTYVNTIAAGDLQTDYGNSPHPAIAQLTVMELAAPPSVVKAFAPDTIVAGDVSTLTITLDNSATTAAVLTTALTDNLPASVVVANPANASTTCPNGSMVAAAGTSAVTLGSGAQIPASGSCTITVSVADGVTGVYTNVINAGELQTSLGNSPSPATATLTVTSSEPVDTIFADGFDGSAP